MHFSGQSDSAQRSCGNSLRRWHLEHHPSWKVNLHPSHHHQNHHTSPINVPQNHRLMLVLIIIYALQTPKFNLFYRWRWSQNLRHASPHKKIKTISNRPIKQYFQLLPRLTLSLEATFPQNQFCRVEEQNNNLSFSGNWRSINCVLHHSWKILYL